MQSSIGTLFLDIGGVLLTNGWDHNARRRACEAFGLDFEEMNDRHDATFFVYEEGKISLDTYLDRVVFDRKRSFTREEFKEFMFDQTRRCEHTPELFRQLKAEHDLKVIAVSNEGRELTEYRINECGLRSLIDVFVVSCFVGSRKPDEAIYRIALDICQTPLDGVVYIEDRELYVEVAESMGIRSILHKSYESTRAQLAELGLSARASAGSAGSARAESEQA
jgi:putative hydrolase of the HAD superfamily